MNTSIAENNIDNAIDLITRAQRQKEREEYKCPVASTDILGIDKLDPRLADRIWRLNNLYTVIDEDGNLVKFQLREAQEVLLMNMHLKNIILKARQLGFTTFICIFLLDYALFNSNKLLGIVAHTQTDATVIFRKVKVAWDNFPIGLKEFMNLTTDGDSKTEYMFSNGSIMRISTSLRSGTYQAVLITEFGKVCAHFPEKAEEIITGTLPAANKGLVFIESTDEGEVGDYYNMVQDAIKLEKEARPMTNKDFKFFFFPWYKNPANALHGEGVEIPLELQSYFKKIERETGYELSKDQMCWYYIEKKTQRNKMQQEHPSTPDEAFYTAGNKLFSMEVLQMQEKQFAIAPYKIDGDYKYFKPYQKGHMYGLGADVGKGTGGDHSAIVVIDFTTGEIVFTYKSNKIDPVLLAYEIKKIALEYGGCIAAPESNSIGHTTCITLNNIYGNIYTQVRAGMLEETATSKLGWDTNGVSKPKMVYEFADAVSDGNVKCLDIEIVQDARKLNKEDTTDLGRSASGPTKHLDLFMAACIAYQMRAYTSKGKAEPEDVARVEVRRSQTLSRTRGGYR
jgi:hypothetical protein